MLFGKDTVFTIDFFEEELIFMVESFQSLRQVAEDNLDTDAAKEYSALIGKLQQVFKLQQERAFARSQNPSEIKPSL